MKLHSLGVNLKFLYYYRETHDKRVAKEIADKLERDLQEQRQRELLESEEMAQQMQARNIFAHTNTYTYVYVCLIQFHFILYLGAVREFAAANAWQGTAATTTSS